MVPFLNVPQTVSNSTSDDTWNRGTTATSGAAVPGTNHLRATMLSRSVSVPGVQVTLVSAVNCGPSWTVATLPAVTVNDCWTGPPLSVVPRNVTAASPVPVAARSTL